MKCLSCLSNRDDASPDEAFKEQLCAGCLYELDKQTRRRTTSRILWKGRWLMTADFVPTKFVRLMVKELIASRESR